MRCERLDHRSTRGILFDIERRLDTIERMIIIMAEDFTALASAIDTVTSEISEVITILQNPATDNNNQSTIDSLTSRLSSAATALQGALPAPAPALAPSTDQAAQVDNTQPGS